MQKKPTVAFWYEGIRNASTLAGLGKVDLIVTTQQPSTDKAAIAAIHQHGSQAFRYFQSYWYPAGASVDGLDMSKHMDFAFCESGSTPRVGKTQGGHQFYFLDTNEIPARQFILGQLKKLHSEGYDGVFFDRGLASLTGSTAEHAGIWYKKSTCTSKPYKKNATFSDAYVSLFKLVHQAGLKLMLNYGYSPFDPNFRFRPDPTDPSCQADHFSTCRHVNSGMSDVDYFLDEGNAYARDIHWQEDFAANRANEQDPHFGGRVIVLITQVLLENHTGRANVYSAFAKVRLFNVPVAIFTGDDGCKGISNPALCNRQGIYPELTNADFGTPIDSDPQSTQCASGSKIDCVWYRTYSKGLDVINVTPRTVSVTVPIGGSQCHTVTDIYSKTKLDGGKCVTSVTLELGPWAGRPMLYS